MSGHRDQPSAGSRIRFCSILPLYLEPSIGIERSPTHYEGTRSLAAHTLISCTDSTGNRTGGTPGAGTIRRPGPRPRPCVPAILLLCVNVADDMDPRPQADTGRGGRLICMPLRTQSG